MKTKKLKNLIIQKVTGFSKSQLFLNNKIPDKFQKKIENYYKRLKSGEPIEYIINNAEFYGLDFYIDSRVLIPRNDTEIMVEKVLEDIPEKTILIDVGTGSSCIPISILKNLSTEGFNPLKTFVIDISEKALEVSYINIEKYNLQTKITQIKGNLLSNCNINNIEYKNIIITANLPYIKDGDFSNMDNETIIFEPDLALYGGHKTGFELYEKLIFQILELKLKNIILFIEIGFDQKQVAIDFLNKLNLKFEIFKDNNEIDRCIKIKF